MTSNLKQAASLKALDWVKDGMHLGIGTGSTVEYFIQGLAELIRNQNFKITAISSSFASSILARRLGVPLISFDFAADVDLYVDGADEVDPAKNLIKGRGGAMVQEKILAESAGKFLVVADESKLVPRLGTKAPVPVEVLPIAHATASLRITALGGLPVLREAVRKDGPVITDQGNFILDVKFENGADYFALNQQLNCIPGVVGHGIFIGLATAVIIGSESGTRVIE